VVFNAAGQSLGMAQREYPQIFPSPGHVEHDPEAIWSSQLHTGREALVQAGVDSRDVAAVGITNQRETTILWDRLTGRPIANAIVWQSRITSPECERLQATGVEPMVRSKTGLVMDAYFSATKIKHLLDTIPAARSAAERGDVLFGTVDTFLLWRLTGGRVHATDATNASRTLLYNIHAMDWDDELLRLFNVPRKMLPEVKPTSGVFGETDPQWFGARIPIAALAGDQQAATFGQACFSPGDAKNTYGTGCFLLLNTGTIPVESKQGLLTTIGWTIGGETTYCLEGSVFIAGAVVQWLRDGLGIIGSSQEIEQLATAVPDSGGVSFVPAFVGLGAPYWDPDARGTMLGITRGTTREHIARAAIDSIAFQTADILDAMQRDAGVSLGQLKVDGGASRNNLLMQFQADLLQTVVRRPTVSETTALGAAYLAGLATGVWTDFADVSRNWSLQREFTPGVSVEDAAARLARWRQAIDRSRGWV
jgi:glycerol kinase